MHVNVICDSIIGIFLCRKIIALLLVICVNPYSIEYYLVNHFVWEKKHCVSAMHWFIPVGEKNIFRPKFHWTRNIGRKFHWTRYMGRKFPQPRRKELDEISIRTRVPWTSILRWEWLDEKYKHGGTHSCSIRSVRTRMKVTNFRKSGLQDPITTP